MKHLLFILVLVFFGWVISGKPFTKDSKPSKTSFKPTPAPVQPQFSCDGRQYCSQMNSRLEAEFFNKNCPGTKMDGDYDGIPCERDSRF